MDSRLALPLLLATALVPGALLVALFLQKRRPLDGDWLAALFAALSLGILIIGWPALLLAEAGLFAAGWLAALWLLLTAGLAGLWIWRRRTSTEAASLPLFKSTDPPVRFLPGKLEIPFLLLWLVGAGWLFFNPHEYVIGGADAGVYVNLAANISQTGAILIDDPLLTDLDPVLYPALLRPLPEAEQASQVTPYYLLPGFYAGAGPPGRITPQFYPLHPVWQAVAFRIGGVEASLLMTGLWSILAGLAVYLAAREIAGWEVAALTLTGLTVNALQAWFARYPTTEMLTQFLIWTSLWSTMRWLRGREPRPLWGLLAGLALGQVFLVRIDTYFLLAIPFLAFLWLRQNGRLRREDGWYFLPVILLTMHSFIHALGQSRPYFYSIFGYGLDLARSYWLPLLLGLLAAGALLLTLSRHLDRLERYRRPLLLAACGLIVLLVLYGYFIRPSSAASGAPWTFWYGEQEIPAGLDRQNLLRLGWYLSPLGIGLATAGICLLLWDLDLQRGVILVAGLLFSLMYLWRIQANPMHIYTMRRYVPVVLPFAILAAAYAIGRLLRRKRPASTAAALLLAGLWLAGLIWSGRSFFRQVDYQGLITQLDDLDRSLAPHSVLIFDDQEPVSSGDKAGTPLRFLYGHDILTLRDPGALDQAALQAAVSGWQAAGRTVYWVGDPAAAAGSGLPAGSPINAGLHFKVMEGRYDRKPSVVYDAGWDLVLAPLE